MTFMEEQYKANTAQTVDANKVKRHEIEEILNLYTKNNLPIVTEAKNLLKYDHMSLRLAMQQISVYVWPTTELIEWLKADIPDMNDAIEIGSGNGVLAEFLGVKATDNYMQSDKFTPKSPEQNEYHQSAMLHFAVTGCPKVVYGENVEQLSAGEAIQTHKPNYVFGCYITHKYEPGMKNGNALGVDEGWITRRRQVKTYTMIGNRTTHKEKPILKKEHKEIKLEGLIVRTGTPEDNRIFQWTR